MHLPEISIARVCQQKLAEFKFQITESGFKSRSLGCGAHNSHLHLRFRHKVALPYGREVLAVNRIALLPELNVAAFVQLGGFYLRLVFHGKVYGICDEAPRMSLRV